MTQTANNAFAPIDDVIAAIAGGVIVLMFVLEDVLNEV
jgi:hypothetical protein